MDALANGRVVTRNGDAVQEMLRAATSLSLPLIAFFFIQSAVSIAALAMVGRLGTAAIAGVGIANAVLTAAVSLLYGFDTAVQALVARAIGAGAREVAGRVLSQAHWLSLPLGLALSVLLLIEGHALVGALTSDPVVHAAGTASLSGAAACLTFLAVTIPFNAYWIGSGVPRLTLLVSAIVAPVQIAVTWLLVFGFRSIHGLGVLGAGVAVSIATLLGLGIQLWLGLRVRPIEEFHRRRPRAKELGVIISVGWPVSLQQCLLQCGGVVAFAIVSQIGVTAIALLNVLAVLLLVPTQIATGLGVASAPLVGQALGRGDPAAAKAWGWRLSLAGFALVLPLGCLALIVPRVLLALFLTDQQTLGQAIFPAHLLGAGVSIGAVASILAFALRGAGAIPVLHLDRLVFGPGWEKRLGDVRAEVAATVEADRWVIEGTYPDLVDLFLPNAEFAIWIEQPVLRRLWRAWRKTRIHRGTPRADRPDDCEEGFTLSYIRTILSFGRFAPEVEGRLGQATAARVVSLKGDRDLVRFLRALAQGATPPATVTQDTAVAGDR